MEINSKRKTVEKGDRELGFPVETLKKSFGAGWRVPHPPDWLLPKVVPRNTPPPPPPLTIYTWAPEVGWGPSSCPLKSRPLYCLLIFPIIVQPKLPLGWSWWIRPIALLMIGPIICPWRIFLLYFNLSVKYGRYMIKEMRNTGKGHLFHGHRNTPMK